ncbi:MAG: fluoride efflux transporter CrcB [Flavobacteriaceae bacterium TMED42]|nr:fluoride efflux transporter CrcB [Flavobacteriaceae bacterium]RPG64729.1 MAG: fluoride efflux transporter CrcB [Flavobacteriaceae bacterium TMED42]|tara:strand:+ start:1813 stop:2190 length:378 start_codon:yes stop_codon:yes gene_type:complete
MKQLLIVFIGGGLGTVMRFLIGKLIPYSGKGFPWNTFCANLLGCLLIGLLTGYFMRNSSENQSSLILFATIGFCGGFTTFSSFANENLSFIRSGDYAILLSYSLLSISTGILMVYLGILIDKHLH